MYYTRIVKSCTALWPKSAISKIILSYLAFKKAMRWIFGISVNCISIIFLLQSGKSSGEVDENLADQDALDLYEVSPVKVSYSYKYKTVQLFTNI